MADGPVNADVQADDRRVEAQNLKAGDIVRWVDALADVDFREVRLVEPLSGSAGSVLIVFAGGDTETARGAWLVQLADPDLEKHRQAIRDAARRDAFRQALLRLVDLLDDGLPLPARFGIRGVCMSSPEDVRRAAEMLGVEAVEFDNNGRPHIKAEVDLAPGDQTLPLVELDMWHLGDSPEGGASQ